MIAEAIASGSSPSEVSPMIQASDSPPWWSGYAAFLYIVTRNHDKNDATLNQWLDASDDPAYWREKIDMNLADKLAS